MALGKRYFHELYVYKSDEELKEKLDKLIESANSDEVLNKEEEIIKSGVDTSILTNINNEIIAIKEILQNRNPESITKREIQCTCGNKIEVTTDNYKDKIKIIKCPKCSNEIKFKNYNDYIATNLNDLIDKICLKYEGFENVFEDFFNKVLDKTEKEKFILLNNIYLSSEIFHDFFIDINRLNHDGKENEIFEKYEKLIDSLK